ncbi:MAG: hypothetical protein KDK40_01730 [Chlamydiia bacterium]|nr:hypothetical protein [Chlamydiia bacterium]
MVNTEISIKEWVPVSFGVILLHILFLFIILYGSNHSAHIAPRITRQISVRTIQPHLTRPDVIRAQQPKEKQLSPKASTKEVKPSATHPPKKATSKPAAPKKRPSSPEQPSQNNQEVTKSRADQSRAVAKELLKELESPVVAGEVRHSQLLPSIPSLSSLSEIPEAKDDPVVYEDLLASLLRSSLKLKSENRVIVQITLNSQGGVESLHLEGAESSFEGEIRALHFPPFGGAFPGVGKKTFKLILISES